MNYEKKYNTALDRARELISYCINDRDRRTKIYRVEDIESIFPELKESKDEKIRKAICGWIYTRPSEFFDGGISREEMLTWVKKQNKQCEDKNNDERIRKAIHIYLDWLDGQKGYQPKGEYTIKNMIDWLVKQSHVKELVIFQHKDKTCKENRNSLTRKLDPAKVIRWLRIHWSFLLVNDAIDKFKKDFKL